MAQKTSIEWTDFTWNPIRGCSKISPGCEHCYAMAIAARFNKPGQPYDGLARRNPTNWTGRIRFMAEILTRPLGWKKPRRVFVNSQSDLFHKDVKEAWISKIFAVMAMTPWHTYQALTKRPERAEDLLRYWRSPLGLKLDDLIDRDVKELGGSRLKAWPLPNLHLGVSVENQATTDERIPILLKIPNALPWISAEPLLEEIDIRHGIGPWQYAEEIPFQGLKWVVCGGESGHRARPFHLDWARHLRDQCKAAGVPFFCKQLGRHPRFNRDEATRYFRDKAGGDISEWPEDLRIREWPGDKP